MNVERRSKDMGFDDVDSETVAGSVNTFGNETTVHGVRYIIARGHFLFRLCWFAIIILAFILFVIQAVNVYVDFTTSPYTTKIDIIRHTRKPFPAVTVCNANRIRRSMLDNTSYEGLVDIDDGNIGESWESYSQSQSEVEDTNEETDEQLWRTVKDKYDWLGFYSASQADDFSDLIDVVNPSKEELMEYGHQLVQFLPQCTYNQKPCNVTSDFTVWQSRYYGNCFTFNFGLTGDKEAVLTSKTGALNGLHLTLWVETDEYMGLLSPNRGAKVTIHPLNTLPFPEDEGINVATGMATSIGIREEVIRRLPGMTDCVGEDGANTNFSGTATSYTVAYCLKLCLQQSLIKRCGCVDDILLNYSHCNVLNTTQRNCVSGVHQLYVDDELYCNCPLACSEKNFKKTISSIDWPSDRYMDYLLTKFTTHHEIRDTLVNNESSARRNLIRLQIYFETLNDEVVEQVPRYTIPNILGNWGGLMGLFTGMSFISVFEVIFLLLRVSKISFRNVLFPNRVQPIKT